MRRKISLIILLLCASVSTLFAQTRRISGQILDETGVGLPGAAVSVKGTQVGTATDADGNFQLDIPEDATTIVIRSIGYTDQEINIEDQSTFNVKLSPSATTLEETVVTANAVRREKRSLGYATTQISGNDLNTGGNSSPINALVGKAAGVNINTTANAPG